MAAEGDVLYDPLAEDNAQQEAALLTVQRVVEFPEPQLHLVGETLQARPLSEGHFWTRMRRCVFTPLR
jgi:hypothetical protein